MRVSTPKLGVLENRVTTSKAAPPWNFGISDLMKNLVRRGLLRPSLTHCGHGSHTPKTSGMQLWGRPGAIEYGQPSLK